MKKALAVIDPQKIYTSAKSEMSCADSKNTISRINKLIDEFQRLGLPILFVRHVHKADGSDLGRMFDYTGDPVDDFNFKFGTTEVEYDKRLIIPPDAIHFVKNRYSAFSNADFGKQLRKLEIETLVICGFMTNFCCDSTCRDAHDLDYFVDFIVDATGTPGTDNFSEKKVRSIVTEFLASGYAVVHTTDNYIKQLKRRS